MHGACMLEVARLYQQLICMVELKTHDCVHGGAERAGEWLSAEKAARMVTSMGSSPKEL